MSINKFLNNIRVKQPLSIKSCILQMLLSFIIGVISGILAKYSDSVAYLGEITTRLGIWVFLAVMIAIYSKSPLMAALKVLVFFFGMLMAYYIYSMYLFGFFPYYYFIRWGLLSLISPFGCYFIWYGRGKGWFGALCTAIPVGVLFAMGYPFFYLLKISNAVDILSALVILIIVPINKKQIYMILPLSLFIAFIVNKLNILPLIFGGL